MSAYKSLNGHGEPRATGLYEASNVLNVSKQGRVASIVGGALLTTAAINQIDKHPFRSLFRLIAGGYLLYRGISGNCPVSAISGRKSGDKHSSNVNIRTSLIVDKPRMEVYTFWRQLSNLPIFMKHLVSVEETDSFHSHWKASGPGGVGTLEWDAEITKDEPGNLIGWRSAAGSDIVTAGRINFKDAISGGTEMEIMITYRPPAGYVGAGLAWILNSAFENIVERDILGFKQYVETGAVPV